MPDVRLREEELDGQPVRWFEADGDPDRPPVLYLHGVPMSGRQWRPFLEQTGGLAPDLPGFGRSGKRADLPYDLPFYAAWIQRFLERRGIDRVRLMGHDWGVGLGLAWAQEHPDAVERLVIAGGAPLLPGHRWHRVARLWRTPVVGELVMGATGPRVLRLVSRRAARLPDDWLDVVREGWDLGTERAILRLYRSAPEDVLAAAGTRLGELRCPALVLWGAEDPYVPARLAEAYAAALGGPAEVRVVPGAGHWPWWDEPALVPVVTSFMHADV